MNTLNFPPYDYRTREEKGKTFIFDMIRKKFVVLTPEEWVRQHLVNYLINHLGYSRALISVERSLRYNFRLKRSDVLIFDGNGNPLFLVECKSSDYKLNQKSFDQVAVYNKQIQAPYLMVTNGLKHYCCKIDLERGKYFFLPEVPAYSEIRQDS